MLKKVAIVGVLAVLGMVVGFAATLLGGYRVEIGSTLTLPANSPHSSSDLAAMTRGHHPGAQVWAHGRAITIHATGSFVEAEHAMRVAYGEIVASNDRKIKGYYPDFADQIGFAWGNPRHNGGLGMLAGISVALGVLVPPRSNVARRPRPKRKVGKPLVITLALLGGMAAEVLVLVLAAIIYAAIIRQPTVIGGL